MTRTDSHPNPTPAVVASHDRLALIDAHVHLHPRFDLAAMFDQVAANIAIAAERVGCEPDTPGVLMLAECEGVDRFGELMRRVGDAVGPWQVQACDENESLRLCRTTQQTLYLIAGRQIVTRDRLEVLALGTRRRIDDGIPLRQTIREVRRAGAMPVLPWGFGKWFGRRGRVMRRLIHSSLANEVFIGDNGGRPRCWPTPRLFHEARERGVRLLPGTDPLPFVHQQRRAGQYGFMLPLRHEERRPYQAIAEWLSTHSVQPTVFGDRERWLTFVGVQFAMQWHRRFQKRRRVRR